MSFPFDPNAGTPAPAPTTPNLTHYQHHLAASIVLGAAYGGLTCKNRPDGTPEWTLYFWRPDGPSMGLTCTGNPMELVQQAGDTLAPHRGDKVFLSLQELAADDPVSLLMVYEESRRALLSMIPINGHPTTWLPEHGWLLPEGMANVERGDDCSEDGEGFTLDPKEAVMAWWAFFAGARAENGALKATIEHMKRYTDSLHEKHGYPPYTQAAPPRIHLPAQPSPETDRQLAEVRAVYAAYRKGGRIGRVDIQAAPGHHLPERAGDLHHKAALWIGILLREIDFLRSVLMLDWKPWYPEDADTSQPPWCYVAETGELRAEVTRLVNQENDSDEQRWHWQISFIADPGQDDENAVQLREAKETLPSHQEAIEAAEAAYARLTGFRR